ncbi:MAG: formylglycine-generating enzyme family protein [Deltaproteobacteria bacterium]|nr:formylglycine-generating enzyme family protein [Deltaproteobacteria bacterium]
MTRAPVEVVTDVLTGERREERFYHWQLPDGTKMEMVWVPAGTFTMGGDGEAFQAVPGRAETISEGFYLGRFPVTVGQFEAFVDRKGYKEWKGRWPGQGPDHPVVNVSWFGGWAFGAWAGLVLPTERHWEYAARDTNGRIFPWGDAALNDQLLWWSGSGTPRTTTCAVREYLGVPSPFGAKLLVGNVWEWTSTEWERDSVAGEALFVPGAKVPTLDPSESSKGLKARVLRGGGWSFTDAAWVRASARSGLPPSDRLYFVGLRCARPAARTVNP